MRVEFISISTISSIPITRYLVDFFRERFKVSIHETHVKSANSYFDYKSNVSIKPIQICDNFEDYHSSIGNRSLFIYFKLILKLIPILLRSDSLIYTNNHQVLALVLFFKKIFRLKRTKVIYHQFELIAEEQLGRLSALLFNIAAANITKVDLVVFPEINRMNYFSSKLEQKLKNRKTFILPNTTELSGSLKINNRFDWLPIGSKMCLHVGVVGGRNHFFNEFLEVVKILNKKEKIVFVIIGRLSKEIELKLNKLNLDNLVVLSTVPHEELKELYIHADYGFILYKGPGLNYEFCAPNKLYEYWSFGVPVIAHQLRGLIPLFKKKFQGALVDFNNQEEVIKIITEKKDLTKDRKNLMRYFSEKHEVGHYLERLNNKLIELKVYE